MVKSKAWYAQPIVLFSMAGGLTFLAIYTETYYVSQSFYNYKFYYLYSFGLAVYIMLLICSACVSVVSTYIFLNSEDYRWPWVSFTSSASCSVYMFGYAVYFYCHTKMHGFYQFLFFFGYTDILCLVVGLICGAVGYLASNLFVWTIYSRIKND